MCGLDLVLLIFINLTQSRTTWEEETSLEELLPSDWSAGHFF